MNLEKFFNMNEIEKYNILYKMGYCLSSSIDGHVHIPIYEINELIGVYKSGTVEFSMLLYTSENPRQCTNDEYIGGKFYNRNILISHLKRGYLEQTGKKIQFPENIKREIKRKQENFHTDQDDRRWKLLWSGVVGSVKIHTPSEYVGRVRIHDQRNPLPPKGKYENLSYCWHEAGKAMVKIFRGKTRSGRPTIEIKIFNCKVEQNSNLQLEIMEDKYSSDFNHPSEPRKTDGEYSQIIFADGIGTHRSNNPCREEWCEVTVGIPVTK